MAVIVLALDGFDKDLLTLSEFGTIHDLFKNNPSSLLESTMPYLTPSAFVSMQTGKSVGKHGVAGFLKFDAKSKTTRPYRGSDIKDRTFYEILDTHDKKCFLFSMPYSYPPRIEGDIVFDWLSVGGTNMHSCVYPSTLLDVYPDLVDYELFPDRSSGMYDFLLKTKRSNNNTADVINHVISSKRYDFYFFLIRPTDWIQHFLHKDIMDGARTKNVNIAKDIFASIDKIIRDVLQNMRGNDSLILMSDHGFTTYNERFYINDWLKENGYLVTSDKVTDSLEKNRYPFLWENASSGKIVKVPSVISRFVRKHHTSFKILEPIKGTLSWLLNMHFVVGQPIDLEHSTAFSVEEHTGAIYINKSLSQKEVEDVKKEIISKLRSINGMEVYDSKDLYGEFIADGVADIHLNSSRYWIKRGLAGTIFSDVYQSHHRKHGVLALVGDVFEKAPVNARVMDLAPTILHMMDCPIPDDMEGRVIIEAFTPKLANKSINYIAASTNTKIQEQELSSSEQEIIEERLRKLGYI